MAKASSSAAAKGRGQSTLNAFIVKKKKEKLESEDEADADDVDDVDDETEEDDVDMTENIPAAVIDKKASPQNSNLPPISSIPAIFTDLVSRIPDISKVAERIQGRKLRVATMCSGTESPLLALELIQNSIEELYNTKFDIEHVFSCEIEPFKQAYIERNFSPPILFRDICELGGDEATTAYGSEVPVPGDVDLLIAGTSCVDYSSLNNEKQDIDSNGESGRTFRGMMSWVDRHRPPLVILENVCSAPWDRVVKYFEKNKYSAAFFRVDTKNYYIPHTRTRVYLLAVHQRNSSMPKSWKELVGKLQRPASTTLDHWMLPTDDQRIHQARQKLVQESYGALDRRTGRTDWGRCESRHQRARLEEALGPKRPLTSWDEGGYCKLPDFAWGDWGVAQVERVWDLMDITLLRYAKQGIDSSFKTQVWNLSQNVDREIGSKRLGVCPCLTPSMIPYITNRGGPMVGLEALSMQGLPVDKLLLTRETEDQLADLAGNAMSTTVVGACMLAALVICRSLLKKGDDQDTYEEKAGNMGIEVNYAQAMDVDDSTETNVESRVSGEAKLTEHPLDLSTSLECSLPELLVKAQASARLCECEGRSDMTSRLLSRCEDCDTSSCDRCGGRPEHNYHPIDFTVHPRLAPSAFARELKAALPMSMSFKNITGKLLDELKVANTSAIHEKMWSAWRTAVLRAASIDQRFVELKRQEIWVATFKSPVGGLEILLHPQQPEWRFFAKAEDSEPANSEIRRILDVPVARMRCDGGLLKGKWEIALPKQETVKVMIKGVGEHVPAWETRLGLLDDYKDRLVYSKIEVSIPKYAKAAFDRDISGVYTLLDKCGTATGALHKKESKNSDISLPPLFFFLDPTRCGTADEDPFVFSISKRRYQFGETRPVVCKLDPKWRQANINDEAKTVSCHIPCVWVSADAIIMQSSEGREARFAVPADSLEVNASNAHCASAIALLVCKVPLKDQAGPEWPRGKWVEVDKVNERVTFQALAWLIERIKNINEKFDAWTDVSLPEHEHAEGCARCSPTAPSIKWMRDAKNKIRAVEDVSQAGAYERALKNRPAPFVTQLKLDEESGVGTVRIGINIPSLVHRAFSRLPTLRRTENPQFAWRLDTDFRDPAKLNLPKLRLTSNRRDPEHTQPKHFKIPLRPEQLRSLSWMLEQESLNAKPFVEEEIAEAILNHLSWRAQGRAQRPVCVRGGVLADEVGYGKTAITLGLIDSASKSVRQEPRPPKEQLHGKIYVRATLIVVPPHLTRQWGSEIKKFTGDYFEVIVVSTAGNLNSLTIKEVQDADIIVVASNLFHSGVYLSNLEAFAAGGTLPSQDGRQVERLRTDGSEAAMKAIHDARRRDVEADVFVQKKRLKGVKAREAAEAKAAAKKEVMEIESDSDGPVRILPPSNKIVEVVIPVSKPLKLPDPSASSLYTSDAEVTAPPTSEAPSGVESSDGEKIKPRPRTRAGHVSFVESSEEEDNAEGRLKAKEKARAKKVLAVSKLKFKKPVKRKAGSSDYDDSAVETGMEEEEYDNFNDLAEESENEPLKKSQKSSKPSRPAKKAKKTAAPSDVEMDDDALSAKAKGKKRKIDSGDNKAVKKQKLREETDPWKLESKAKKDWKQMHAPPLEMFHFERLVIDEYTYLDGKILSLVQKLTATRRWVLSGTPPIHDFASLKTIAAFLDIHLGVDDDGEGQSVQVKKRKREQTDVEKFHSFREVRSLEWHAHRHDLGQGFLDQFVRQNIAEIDEIPWVEKIEKIDLPAAERAIYLELEHHLRALDMTIKRGKKTESDREKRLAQALGESNSAEEALLKRCSHFDLDTKDEENAMKACEVIVQERTKQLDDCKQELIGKLKDALVLQRKIGKTADETYFQEYVRVTRDEGVGDRDASAMTLELLKVADIDGPLSSLTDKSNDVKSKSGKDKGKGKGDMSINVKDLIWEIREQTHHIRRLTKELVGRVRSLRYFTVVRDLQRQAETPPTVICPTCGNQNVPIEDIAVLSSCGHTGCMKCVMSCAEREECVYAQSGACKAAARVLNVVKGDTLGVDDVSRDGNGRHFGLKLEKVVELIKKRIPKEERILAFVQFPDLMKKVAEAFDANRIKYLEIKGSASVKSKNLEKFQNGSEERVLLLTVTDESASGANLTSANHAIFLSPLLTTTQEIYDACETQAIGRLRRYGQTKEVKIWRFLSTNTIDIEIFEQRTKRRVH
ncbi:hypothetical protein EW145_g6533 [Phellinidium pouzarii]|uniref:Helicase ATP-binding domain-containing protein n=1 Tax=Phellinidium pouzarii TaxID=167371 RepID=A0A4S4KWV5_9AGAM|nr:hypothetical protein EW145_g6533 [Phellinidium pouzarii]